MYSRLIFRLALTVQVFLCAAADSLGQTDTVFTRDQLLADARQLCAMIEATHPDPYTHGGGRIEFHRRFQALLQSIPDTGMDRWAFYRLSLPFVAAMGDSHTGIRLDSDVRQPGPGLPVGLKIIEQDLVVMQVSDENYRELLGARLASLHGVPLDTLLTRQRSLRGCENVYGGLAFLTRSLQSRAGLANLLPEWQVGEVLQGEFILPDDVPITVHFRDSDQAVAQSITPATQVKLPPTAESDITYGFLDRQKQTALLIVRSLMRYREAFESLFADGMTEALPYAQAAYTHFHASEPPADTASLLAAIPSAAATLAQMVEELKAAGTRHLIVDLRDNTGGNSVLREMLIYFLFGRDGLANMRPAYSIRRLSPLYFETYTSDSLSAYSGPNGVPLDMGDYDFSEQARASTDRRDPGPRLAELEQGFARIPSFYAIYQREVYHRPEHSLEAIAVLCTPLTYSSGFNVLTALYDRGAAVVGTPSGQPGNNFGDVLFFRLDNTGIQSFVSHKQVVTFPDDPARGQCLVPDVMLSYEKLRALAFDPNAEVLLAREWLESGGRD